MTNGINNFTKAVNPDGTFTRPILEAFFNQNRTQETLVQTINTVETQIKVLEREVVVPASMAEALGGLAPLDILVSHPYFIYAGRNISDSTWFLLKFDNTSRKIVRATQEENETFTNVEDAFDAYLTLTYIEV